MTPEILIGREADMELSGLVVQVRILEIKGVFGRLVALVTPITGAGEKWVNLSKLKAIA